MKFRTERPEEVMMSMLLPQCRPQRKLRGTNIDPKEERVGYPRDWLWGVRDCECECVCVQWWWCLQ